MFLSTTHVLFNRLENHQKFEALLYFNILLKESIIMDANLSIQTAKQIFALSMQLSAISFSSPRFYKGRSPILITIY
jgi:hypothetical protein